MLCGLSDHCWVGPPKVRCHLQIFCFIALMFVRGQQTLYCNILLLSSLCSMFELLLFHHLCHSCLQSRAFLEMIIDSQPLRKFQIYYATWRFIGYHLCLFWARLIKSTPFHSVTLWFILILSYHLCLGHPSSLFLSGLCTNILYTLSSLCMYYMHHPFHSPWFNPLSPLYLKKNTNQEAHYYTLFSSLLLLPTF
jgi:hypothetical protein